MHKRLRRLNRRIALTGKRHVRRLRVFGRHPLVIPVAAFLLLAALTAGAWWWLARHGTPLKPASTDIVIISYDHHTRTVPSHEPTVGALLAKLHIAVNAGDVVEPAAGTAINQDDFRINIYRAAPVKIVDGATATFGYSAATTPRSIAEQTGLTVYPEDELSTQPVTNFLQEHALGNVITIKRSTPVTLNVNGFAAATRTQAKTVGEFLAEKHIELGKNGRVRPSLGAAISANQTIRVVRDGTGVQSQTQTIAMPVTYVNDASLAYGTFAVRQAGSPGRQVLTYRVTVKNGKVIKKTLIQKVTTEQPVTQIEARGTNLSGIKGDMARAGIAPSQYQYADYIISNESGWCPTKWQGEYGGCPSYHGAPASPYVGYGLCQATPGYKMASAGSDWATNPITQLEWCTGYANSRYGSWYNAYLHWQSYHNW